MPLKKTILVALITVLVLGIPLIWLLWPADLPATLEEEEEQPTVQILVDQNHGDHLERLCFTAKGKESISISRIDGGWQITDRPGLPVDPAAMRPLLAQYEQILALRRITEQLSDPAEYGLDQPSLTVTITDHGSDKTYLFGDKNEYYEGYYFTVEGSGQVYLVDYAYFTASDLTVEELLLQKSLPDLSALTAITWTSANGTSFADTTALQEALGGLKIQRLVDYGSEQYAVYKLDKAAVGVIELKDGSTLTLHLSIGETDELIYLTVDDQELIYLVTCEKQQALLDAIGKE